MTPATMNDTQQHLDQLEAARKAWNESERNP